jgi:hypothetical protein
MKERERTYYTKFEKDDIRDAISLGVGRGKIY